MMSAEVGSGEEEEAGKQFWVLVSMGKLPDSFLALARNEKGESYHRKEALFNRSTSQHREVKRSWSRR